MSLIFCDSFDHYATAQLGQKWDAVTGAVAVSAGEGRRSTAAVYFAPASPAYSLSKTVPTSATYIVGFSVRVTEYPTNSQNYFISFWEGATVHLSVCVNTNGTITVKRGSASTGTALGTTSDILGIGTTYFMEIKVKVNDTTGTVQLKCDGTDWLNLSGVDTRNAGTAGTIDAIRIANSSTAYCIKGYLDDFYICDTNGSVNNDFLGDVRIDCVMPNADGTYLDGTPSTGTTHYTLVDEIPPGTSDYVSLTSTNQKDTYGFAAMASVGTSSIKALQVVGCLTKSDSGSRGASSVVVSGAATGYSAASKALSTSQSMYCYVHETDPNTSAAWTEANVNAAEFGIRADA